MAEKPDLGKPEGVKAQWHFDIITAPGFVLLELASVVDVLRLANRVCPHPPFTYTYRSLKGGPSSAAAAPAFRPSPLRATRAPTICS